MLVAKLMTRGKFVLQSIPPPVISQPDEVLVRILQVGICGSDLHYFRHGAIGDQIIKYPFTIGHEAAGVVQEAGKETELKPGDYVVINPALSCGQCDQCLAGRPHTCRRLKFLGCPGQLEGCLQEFIVIPEKNCSRVREEIFPLAILAEPMAIALYAVHMAGQMKDKNVAVFGCGPIGLGLIWRSHLEGSRKIAATDKIPDRLEAARRFGTHWVGNPAEQDIVAALKDFTRDGEEEESSPEAIFDYAFDCCGDQEAITQAISVLRPGGKLIIIGIPETNLIYFDPHLLRRKEIIILHVRRQNNFFLPAIEFLQAHQAKLRPLITHHFPLSEIQRAFELASGYKDGVIKAVIDI